MNMDKNFNSDIEKNMASFCDDIVFEAGMLEEYSDMLEAIEQAGIKISEHTREFLHDISETDYPDEATHEKLVAALISGDCEAAAELSAADLRVALAAALRFYENCPLSVQDDENLFPELLEEASLGLVDAVSEYNNTKQGDFRSFAAAVILKSLEKFVSENADAKGLPDRISEMLTKISRSDMVLEQKLSREATPEEIAADTGYSVGEVEAIMEMMEDLADSDTESGETDECCGEHDHEHDHEHDQEHRHVHYDIPNNQKN